MSAAEWDAAASAYPDATIFHRSSWHDCLVRSLPGRMVHFEILAGDALCGHWCGLLVRKLGASVFGAPLPGSGTDYMFPLFSRAPPPTAFLGAVRDWAKARRISMVDLGGPGFAEADLAAAGFKTHSVDTYRVDLSGGPEEVWKKLKPAMRNKVRKAEKCGVVITRDHSTEFPARFSRMLRATFARRGLSPSYSLERIENVVRILAQTDRVMTLTAYKDEEPVAASILLVDGNTGYYWGGASYESAYPLGANDLIQWRALALLMERGVRVYDTCGGGDYKTKFGGNNLIITSGHLCITPWFGAVRALVRSAFLIRRNILGQVRRITRPRRC